MNERLKLLRKTLKLSQDAFAERIGMKGSSISLLESGGRNITYHDAVNSFDEIVVGINEHLTVTSSQPYIINIKFTAD